MYPECSRNSKEPVQLERIGDEFREIRKDQINRGNPQAIMKTLAFTVNEMEF